VKVEYSNSSSVEDEGWACKNVSVVSHPLIGDPILVDFGHEHSHGGNSQKKKYRDINYEIESNWGCKFLYSKSQQNRCLKNSAVFSITKSVIVVINVNTRKEVCLLFGLLTTVYHETI